MQRPSARWLGVATILLGSSPALPCSMVIPSLEHMTLSFTDGAEVPPNALFRGDFTLEPDGSAWWLVDEQDETTLLEIDVEPEEGWTTLRPPERLAEGARFRLMWSASPNEQPVENDDTVSFSTTDADDVEAPAAPEVASETESIGPRFGDSCGDYGGGTWARFFVVEQPGVAVYRLRSAGGTVLDATFAERFFNEEMDGIFLSVAEEKGGGEEYTITAVDHAGNESEPTIIPMWLGCPGSCSSGDTPAFAVLLLALATRRLGRHAAIRARARTGQRRSQRRVEPAHSR